MRALCIYIFFCLNFITEASAVRWDNIAPIPLNLSESAGHYIHTLHLDTPYSPALVLQLAQAGRFQSNTVETVNIQTKPDIPVWMYIKTSDFDPTATILFVLATCHFDHINLYEYKDGKLVFQSEKGMHVPYDDEAISPEQINFNIKPNTIYFFECYTEYNALFPVYARDVYSNARSAVVRNMFNAFYWGVLGIICLTALLFFIRSKEYLYLFYAIFLLGMIFLNLTLEGYLFAYFWPTHPEWNDYKYAFFSITSICTPAFVYLFLELQYYTPKLKFLFVFFTIGFILTTFIGFIGYLTISLILLQIIGSLQSILYIFCGVYVHKKGYKESIYFIIAWGVYLSSVVYTILCVSNFIESTPYTNNYIQIGSLFEVIVFSFAIAGRFQQYKLKDRQLQSTLIDVLKDRESSLQNQNELLESIVRERTQELNKTNSELSQLNLELNNIVNTKTSELQKSLEEINAYNLQLQQFNYITSHNLRGPLSSLKGLYNLYQTEESYMERRLYIEKSKDVIDRMDIILTDLNAILSQRGNANAIHERIDFDAIIENNLMLLNAKDMEARVIKEIDSRCLMNGIKSFYESIFYNIISNALKYKKPTEPLELLIQVTKSKHNTCTILVQDNGIGMDLTKVGDKLFGFYKRFHTHVDGKGLGLFITKTQVTLIGGTIRVESFPNRGTTYIIDIPIVD